MLSLAPTYLLSGCVCVSGPSDMPHTIPVPPPASASNRAQKVASTSGRLNAQLATTSAPLLEKPKAQLDYKASLSSGTKPLPPYQGPAKFLLALGALGTDLAAARQACGAALSPSQWQLFEAELGMQRIDDLRAVVNAKGSSSSSFQCSC